ncbi:MAG: hypothetical protein LBL45_04595 [Treponema sp.]|jgi:hypothetical protein|nr:hypothetical protein [Treponema sp.]
MTLRRYSGRRDRGSGGENGRQEMASGAERIDTAVSQVNGASEETKKRIERLMNEASRFKA